MNKEAIDALYRAFLIGRVVRCNQTIDSFDITYVEDNYYKTDLFIRYGAAVEISVMQEIAKYPLYDSLGNLVKAGI